MCRVSRRLVGLGYALPGTVVAIGVLVPFAWFDNRLSEFMVANFNYNTGLLLSGTVFILVFAYLVRFLPIALNTVDAGLTKIRPSMDEAGRSMGLSPAALLRRVHIPIMRGSLATALLLVFVDVLKELPATLLLRPFNFNTLAIRTFELANEERLADAAGPALAIVLASLILLFFSVEHCGTQARRRPLCLKPLYPRTRINDVTCTATGQRKRTPRR